MQARLAGRLEKLAETRAENIYNFARCKAQLRQGYVRVLRSYSDDQDQVQRGDRQLIGHSLPEFLPVAGPSSNISSAHVVHAGVEQDGGTQDANTVWASFACTPKAFLSKAA